MAAVYAGMVQVLVMNVRPACGAGRVATDAAKAGRRITLPSGNRGERSAEVVRLKPREGTGVHSRKVANGNHRWQAAAEEMVIQAGEYTVTAASKKEAGQAPVVVMRVQPVRRRRRPVNAREEKRGYAITAFNSNVRCRASARQ